MFGLRRPTTSPRRFPFGSPHPITYRHRPALELPSAEGFFPKCDPGGWLSSPGSRGQRGGAPSRRRLAVGGAAGAGREGPAGGGRGERERKPA